MEKKKKKKKKLITKGLKLDKLWERTQNQLYKLTRNEF